MIDKVGDFSLTLIYYAFFMVICSLTLEVLLLLFMRLMHFLGQEFTHSPHIMHLNAFNFQVEFALSTSMASAGHFLWHNPQYRQLVLSKYILPLVLSKGFLSFAGYSRVTGLLKKFFITLLNIPNIIKPPRYLSVQLIHGSIVRISTGTSGILHPGSILRSDGIFAKVGVLIFSLLKFLVPFAFI